MDPLRTIIADDERPAREFLKALLADFEGVRLVGEAEGGLEAVELIRGEKPDLALIDLKMPEVSGIEAVRLLSPAEMPLIAFVTAHDDSAVEAFELNALDYLLKPVTRARLAETIERAAERRLRPDWHDRQYRGIAKVTDTANRQASLLTHIPVRARDEIYLVPTAEVVAVVADGELLRISTARGKTRVINHRLKDLESRLDPLKFIRLSRGVLVNVEFIAKISPMPGGTYSVTMKNGFEADASREQSRRLRERLLKL